MSILAELRQQVARLEGLPRLGLPQLGLHGEPRDNPTLRLGIPSIDRHLPWHGLPLGCIHEVHGDSSAIAFCAALLARGMRRRAQPAVWITAEETLYGPGLAAFGLPLTDLLVVLARSATDILWAAEEALREAAVSIVVAEITDLDLTASRRLQLAAETGTTLGLTLRPTAKTTAASVTRWRVVTAPSGFAAPMHTVGLPRWSVHLERCRGGRPKSWQLEWCDATGGLTLAAPLPDRPALPAAGSGARPALALAG